MNLNDDEIVNESIREYEQLSSSRANFESHWREIADRVSPNDSTQFQTRMNNISNGEKRTQFVYDSTAAVAANRFAAILDSLLTPRNQTWHKLKASNPDLMKNRDVQLYFDIVNRNLFRYRYAPKANFASQNQQNYHALGCFGSGSMFIDPLRFGEKGLRYRYVHLGQIFFVENHQGIVDKCYRYFKMTARQAVQKWGDSVPEDIRKEIHKEKEFFFLHRVSPRTDDYEPDRLDKKGMRWASYYISLTGKRLLSEEGYRTFPYAISRYVQCEGEIYGRSPAMDVLPSIKTLNEEKKTWLRAGRRAVDPVLLAFDDGIVDSFNLRPGAVNAGGVSSDGRPLVHALPTGNFQVNKEMIDDERTLINDAFLISLFQILTESPQMTATEVLERTKEKGILLAPTVGRQQSEYLGPMIEREIDILVAEGLLPPMPQILSEAKGEYHVQYDSPLSRAQRAEEASGLQRTIESILQVVNITQDPAPLDNFDFDTITNEIADIQGVPAHWLKDAQTVQAIRSQRAQEKQTQTMIQGAPAAAAMMKASAVASKGK